MHGSASLQAAARPLAIARWLLAVAVMVVLIVLIGGITRLTESGVSITEWKPVTGMIPPLTGAQWQAEFGAYRQTPQYIQINGPAGMTLATYKFIFFWEWAHRLLARRIGDPGCTAYYGTARHLSYGRRGRRRPCLYVSSSISFVSFF